VAGPGYLLWRAYAEAGHLRRRLEAAATDLQNLQMSFSRNGYFERMSRAISDHRGHVSTFIGDGILALFGALESNSWQGNDAVHAALAMRAELEEYNRELVAEGLPELSIGIGLQRGTGVAGLVGSKDLMEFAFVGRTVNIAARVQELTRQYPADVILTDALQRTLDSRFVLRELAPAQVKGVAEPLVICAVERFEPSARASVEAPGASSTTS
jgi:adenylate cyclase